MAEPENPPPTPPQPSTSHAAEAVAAGDITPRRSDNKYAPTLFYGKSNEDADTYVAYIERYKAYKHLSDDEVLELLPVLLRDAASDLYDSLTTDQKTNWTDFKNTFLKRFGRSTAQRWNDTNTLWTEKQVQMNVDVDVTKVTRLAKRLPDLDEAIVRHAIIRGLKSHIRSHVLQADVKSMTELLHAATVAEMVSSAADTEVSGALEELRESNRQQLTAFQQLTERINKLSMTPLDNATTQNDYNLLRRRQSPRRVRFNDQSSRRPSAARRRSNYYDDRRQQPPAPSYRRPPVQLANSTCNRCGRYHAYRSCPVVNADCMNCQRRGHFSNVCRAGRRMNTQF